MSYKSETVLHVINMCNVGLKCKIAKKEVGKRFFPQLVVIKSA